MKYKCSSASLCSQKRHTRWHVLWPLRSEALRAVSSPAVRIATCVPFSPTVTTRAEKPHERSLPSLPRRHIRQLRGIRWVGAPPGSIRPGSLPLCVYLSMDLSMCLSICLSIYRSIYLSTCLSISLSIYLSVYLSISLCIYLALHVSIFASIDVSIYLSIYLSVYLSIYVSMYLCIYLCIYLSICL